MKKTAMRIGAFGLAVATCASLAACSGSTANTSASATSDGSLSWPSMWWSDPGAQFQQALSSTYQKEHPQATLSLTPTPFSEYHPKMYTEMASGQGPDIVTPYDPQMGQWAREGLLEPLDECLAKNKIDTGSLIPSQQLAQYEGKTYGLIYYANPRVLVYNQQLFKEAGVSAPKNLAEFMSAIKATKDATKQQFGFGTVTGSDSPAATYQNLMSIVAGFGGAFVTDGKATADSSEVADALQFVKDLYDNGEIAQGQTDSAYREAFSGGKIASIVTGGFMFATVAGKNPEVAKQLDAIPLPFPAGKTISVNVFLSIPAGAKNKDAACDLIATSMKPELQSKASSMISAIPSTGAVDKEFLSTHPYFQAIVDAADVAVSYAPQGAEEHTAEISQVVTDVYQEMLNSGTTGKAAGAKIQSQIQNVLKN